MTLQNGRFDDKNAEDILDALMADAKEYFGEDLNDNDLAIVRIFYRPIAERLAETQDDIGLVLESAQIDYAKGSALDLLTALIGISREPAVEATGTVTFSRDTNASVDYTISSGTIVQTDSDDPIEFETTDTVTLSSGSQSVDASVKAIDAGAEGNVGSNTLIVMPDPPSGVESVTNAAGTINGADRENDDELRNRAKDELSQGARASAPALVNQIKSIQGVTSVSIFINDGNIDQIGSSDKGFEIVAAGGNDGDIAQAILDTKAGGDTSWGGYNGTTASAEADIGNGQTFTINFSRPSVVTIYVDASLDVTDKFAGNDDVEDSIVNHIGGILTSGQQVSGLEVGEDVIYGEIEYAIRQVEGVYDITDLQVAKSDPPSGTSNLTITTSEIPETDATAGDIGITTTTVDP